MQRTGSEFGLLLLVLAVLPDRAGAGDPPGTPDDAHSLQCVFNISFNEQRRCMVKVFKDRMLILEYDCYNDNVIYEEQEVKTRNVSKDMKETLKDVGATMRKRLAGLKASKICKDFSILQVRLECHSDANGIFSGSWEFLLDGQRFLVFDPKNGKYKADNSNGEKMEKCRGEWENDENVNKMKEFLKKILLGDCKTWLQDLDWKKVLGTTAAPTTAAASASASASASSSSPTVSATPTTATTTVPAPSKARNTQKNMPRIPWVLVSCVIIVLFIICCIICCIIYKYGWQKRCCSKAPESGSSSRRVSSGWLPFRRRQELTCDQELQPL